MQGFRPAAFGLLLCTALACSPESGGPPPAGSTAQDGAPFYKVDGVLPPGNPQSNTRILSGGTLWDGLGGAPIRDAVVVIRDGRILATGRRGSVEVPADSVGVDVAGRFLMPGLIDSHVHFAEAGTLAIGLDAADLDGLLEGSRCAGITTLLAVDGSARSREAARRASARDDLPAVLWAAGPYVAAAGPAAATVDWPARIRGEFEAGARLLALAPAGTDTDWPLVERLVTLSEASSRPVLGFSLERRQVMALLERGVDRFVHTVTDRPLQPADLETLRTAGAAMSTTAAMWLGLTAVAPAVDDGAATAVDALERRCTAAARRAQLDAGTVARARAAAAGLSARGRAAETNLRLLIDSGTRLVAGSDAGTLDLTHGPGLHRELAALVRLGMTPRQALLAATRHAAGYLGLEQEIGTLAPGRQADLLVLKRNPLEDLSALADIHAVVLNGRWIAAERPAAADGS